MRTTSRELVERIIAPDSLASWYSSGSTLADIAYKLRSEYDIRVSVETVRRWLAEPSEQAAS